MNINSKIKYPTAFDQNERNVFIEGEAYFNIVHNPDIPFRISTENANIEVIGTSFNVTAYKLQENIEVVVSDGVVALSSKDNPDNKIILEKGVRGILDPSVNAYFYNTEAPGFFSKQGFVQGGTSPGTGYDHLEGRLPNLSPYNPKEITNLFIDFK